MDSRFLETNTRLGAYTALGGSLSFIIGAALWIVSGVDIDQALASSEMSSYLAAVAEVRYLLVANLSFWILGALLLGAAGTALANQCVRRPAVAEMGRLCYRTGVPLAIVAFVAWLVLVVQVAPENSSAAILLAESLGWFASRADWVATVLIIGVGPALFSLAGRGDWMPVWLARGGIATAVAGLLTTIAMFTDGLTTYGFLIVPVGLAWMIAAGLVLLRRTNLVAESEPAVGLARPSEKAMS